ncbi:MAG: pyridoxal-phosphate dependent enzyme [Gemmatimonadetes bacterium]|nr:pyridoxal-phosphate dependent enzyme [Gemmatimonadota bacterium]
MRSMATPLEPAPDGLVPGRRVFLKREDTHELGAFKWRGALPTLEQYRARGFSTVVTASTGNHGAATAWAARRLGMKAVVFAPAGASRAKLDLIARQGAEVREEGRDFDEAKDRARTFADGTGFPVFEDGAETAQYTGYGAIAAELLAQLDAPPAAVVVPVGNGALIGGIGQVLRARAPETQVIGVAARDAPVMVLSHQAGHAVPCDRASTFADGLAVRVAIPHAVEVLQRVVHRMLLVSERDIARGVGRYAATGIRAEGAAAAALAGVDQLPGLEGPIALVVTGRNIDESLYQRAVTHPEAFSG